MKAILDLREHLSFIQGARHPIASIPPHFRRLAKAKRRTLPDTAGLFGGLEPTSSSVTPSDSFDTEPSSKEHFQMLDRLYAKESSIDSLAWYVSFHNSQDDWGIFIPMSSVHYLGDRLFKRLGMTADKRVNVAFELLLHHERFHFWTDYALTQFELAFDTALHAPLRKHLSNQGRYLEIEEALANAYMVRKVSGMLSPRQLQRLREEILQAPVGYRDALPYADDLHEYWYGLDEVMKSFVGLHALAMQSNLPVGLLEWRAPYLNERQIAFEGCPVHVFLDQDDYGLPPYAPALITQISTIEETRAFLKMLVRLPSEVQRSWEEKKEELSRHVPGHPEFEKLKGRKSPTFSIRLNDGYRAHLTPHPKEKFRRWLATEVGTHTQMGHD